MEITNKVVQTPWPSDPRSPRPSVCRGERGTSMKKRAKNAKRPVTNVRRPAKGTVNNKKRGAK